MMLIQGQPNVQFGNVKVSINLIEIIVTYHLGTWSGTDCTNKLRPICQHPKFEFDIITNLWSGSDKSDSVETLRRVEQNVR